MIEISTKKMETLLADINKEVAKTQQDYNRLKNALKNCDEELTAKKNLKFTLERMLKLKEESKK